MSVPRLDIVHAIVVPNLEQREEGRTREHIKLLIVLSFFLLNLLNLCRFLIINRKS